MSVLRWRTRSIVTLLAILGVGLSLQYSRIVSGKDKTKPATTAATGENGSESSAIADGSDARPARGRTKAKKKARSETAKRKAKGSTDEMESNQGTTAPGNGSVSGYAPGSSGGSNGNSSSGNFSDNSTAPGNSQNTAGTTAGQASPRGSMGRGTATGKAAPANAPNAAPADQGTHSAIVKKVIDVQNRNSAQLIAQKGIIGSATGFDEDGNVVIKAYTTGTDNPPIPKMIENIPVVEVLTGPIHLAQTSVPIQRQRLPRPVPIGVSVFSNNALNAGTLGTRIIDQFGNVYAMSTNHVLAGENGVVHPVTVGTFPTILGKKGIRGTAAAQPAPFDSGSLEVAADTIGTLIAYVPVDPAIDTNVDVALLLTSKALVSSGTPHGGYGVPTTTPRAATMGLRVLKYGRTTALTSGRVADINVKVQIPFANLRSTAPFTQTDQGPAFIGFTVQADLRFADTDFAQAGLAGNSSFALAGDSGALVVDTGGNPVGMVVATLSNGLVFCNSMTDMMTALQPVVTTAIKKTVQLAVDAAGHGSVVKEARATPESP